MVPKCDKAKSQVTGSEIPCTDEIIADLADFISGDVNIRLLAPSEVLDKQDVAERLSLV